MSSSLADYFLCNLLVEVDMAGSGERDPGEYVTIRAEVFYDTYRRRNGVRPCPGQGFSTDIKIECSKSIREYPLGTVVYLSVVETSRKGGSPFLYSSYKWKHILAE